MRNILLLIGAGLAAALAGGFAAVGIAGITQGEPTQTVTIDVATGAQGEQGRQGPRAARAAEVKLAHKAFLARKDPLVLPEPPPTAAPGSPGRWWSSILRAAKRK